MAVLITNASRNTFYTRKFADLFSVKVPYYMYFGTSTGIILRLHIVRVLQDCSLETEAPNGTSLKRGLPGIWTFVLRFWYSWACVWVMQAESVRIVSNLMWF